MIACAGIEPARAADHDFWKWRDGYADPVYGYSLATPPYGYYYGGYSVNGYPVYGFYDERTYYNYYYGRTDLGYQDTK